MGVIIHNDKGEVMGAMIAKGPAVAASLEAKAVDIGINELVIEGDCAQVISALTSNHFSLSRLGHVYEDIQVLIAGLRWTDVRWVNRSANLVAHSLAQAAKYVVDDVIWLEDTPPLAWKPCTMTLCLLLRKFKKLVIAILISKNAPKLMNLSFFLKYKKCIKTVNKQKLKYKNLTNVH